MKAYLKYDIKQFPFLLQSHGYVKKTCMACNGAQCTALNTYFCINSKLYVELSSLQLIINY